MKTPVANTEVVKRLFDRLIATYEQFAHEEGVRNDANDKGGGLAFIDGLMGCHNFYKAVILDLEERVKDDDNFIRKTAINTLALSLGIPIQYVSRR